MVLQDCFPGSYKKFFTSSGVLAVSSPLCVLLSAKYTLVETAVTKNILPIAPKV